VSSPSVRAGLRAALAAPVLCAFASSCNAVLGSDRYYTVPDTDSAAGPGADAQGTTQDASGEDAREDAHEADAEAGLDATAKPDAEGDASLDSNPSPDAYADACAGDANNSCYACPPTTSTQFRNACTNATCVPFDDQTRLTHLLPDGALPPLPSGPTDAGGN
jgi:hypothetical protein